MKRLLLTILRLPLLPFWVLLFVIGFPVALLVLFVVDGTTFSVKDLKECIREEFIEKGYAWFTGRT